MKDKIPKEEKELIRKSLWDSILNLLQNKTNLFQNYKSTTKDFKASQPNGKKNCKYTMYIYEEKVGVKLEFTGEKIHNDELYDKIYKHKMEIELAFGEDLYWRKDNSLTTRLGFELYIDYTNVKNKQPIISFLVEKILLIQKATENVLNQV